MAQNRNLGWKERGMRRGRRRRGWGHSTPTAIQGRYYYSCTVSCPFTARVKELREWAYLIADLLLSNNTGYIRTLALVLSAGLDTLHAPCPAAPPQQSQEADAIIPALLAALYYPGQVNNPAKVTQPGRRELGLNPATDSRAMFL